ncbi:MarR family winged helix-turn-helix transcriptional regulator [Thalassococcus sp. S3]|uniref:MarR family winged helix-turn-helix transcriptional regulator n=1 Tax=Thalassococcus sp. S3 TaxID=2017482 RepID=UPI0010245BAE|nr:MarR family winged helix-turn-helix transcriptional regulator [Thalassococcus sp. S3]QBF31070.1 MarR family transcriptional regulator [Thalassococcus sp. S3]
MPGHLIRRLNQISVALFAERMAEAGLTLTPVQFAALSAVEAHPGADQARVAGLIAYDRATLGKVIDRLEDRGLIARKTAPHDRRAKALEITQDGRDLLTQARPLVLGFQNDIIAGLTKAERETFVTLLDKVTMAGNDKSRAPLKPIKTGSDKL